MMRFTLSVLWLLLPLWSFAKSPCEDALQQSRYTTQIYSVVVNGAAQAGTSIFYRRPCGGLLVAEEDVNRWRLHTRDVDAVMLDGKPFINISLYPSIRIRYNQQSQSLELKVAPERFAAVQVDFSPVFPSSADRGHWAGFFNWSVSSTWQEAISGSQKGYSLELGALTPKGTFASSWVGFESSSTERDVFRVQSNYIQDDVGNRLRWTLGDYRSRPSAWGLTHAAAGIQLARNYGVDPYFRVTPVSNMRVLLDDASAVSLSRYTFRRRGTEGWAPFFAYDQVLPAGELRLVNLPEYQNGAYQLRVIDAYGQEGYARSRYFFSQGLIKAGLNDFSVDLGARRVGLSDDYSGWLLTAVNRYGVNDWLTVEPHIEAGEDGYAVGLTGLWAVPYVGVVNATVARGERTEGAQQEGEFYALGVENSYNRFAYALGIEKSYAGFVRPYELPAGVDRERLFSSISMDVAAHVGANVSYSIDYENGDAVRRLMGASVRWELLRGRTLSINVRDDLEDDEDYVVTAALSFPFSDLYSWLPGRQGRAEFNNRFSKLLRSRVRVVSELDGDTSASSRINVSTGGGRHVDYWNTNYGVDLFEFNRHVLGLGGGIQQGEGSVTYAHAASGDVVSARLNGGGFIHSDGVHFTRSASRGWALVRLGEGGAGMRVNGFKADDDGDVVIPNLPEYSPTKLSLTAAGLPFNARIDQYEFTATPRYRNVSIIDAPIHIGMNVNIRFETSLVAGASGLVDVPAGAIAEIEGSEQRFYVGYDGTAYVENAPRGRSVVAIKWRGGRCTAIIDVEQQDAVDEIPLLGPYECGVSND